MTNMDFLLSEVGMFAVDSLQAYINETEESMKNALVCDPDIFNEVSICRYVANELIRLIFEHPYEPIEDLIDDFVVVMSYWRKETEGQNQEFIFSTAAEFALQWRDYFSLPEELNY